MVYKIRNKTFFLNVSGYKNNYNCKVLNSPAVPKPETTHCMRFFKSGPYFIRYHQQYRNISRKCKQYVYGDKQAEEEILNTLRNHFTMPRNLETPLHLMESDPLRRLSNQGDRDYELLSYNTHPYQLEFYKANNQALQDEMEAQALRDSGGESLEEQFMKVLEDRLNTMTEKKGRPVNSTELREVMEDVYSLYVSSLGAQKSRLPNGDFNDFMEVRRPFTNSDVNSTNVKTA